MPLLRALTRAKPSPVRLTGGSQGQSLQPIAQWQNAMFGNWPTATEFPWWYVTVEEALDLPVVGGFIGITSSLLLQMPLHGYRNEGGQMVPLATDPPILDNPSPGPSRTFGDFINEYLRDMVLYGNFVAILGPLNAAGWPDVMAPVPAGQWQINTEERNGYSVYWYLINGIRYEPEKMFHVTMNQLTGELVGRGVLSLYKRLIASSVAAERWAAMYFEGGAVPPGVVKHPNPELTQEQANLLKAKMKAVAQQREWAVVPGGTDLEVLDNNAEQAQMNETRKLNSQQLAMAMGIPGALLGLDAPSLTYRNITDVFQQFITTTVMSYIVPLEQQLTLQCLPRTTHARFFQANVLRPDLEARVDLATKCFQSGLFTAEEARVFFDLGAVQFIEQAQRDPEQIQ
jgi:HK97 family phage portal protein